MKNTRMITEGALMLVIFIVMLSVSFYVPLLSIVVPLFLIFPFVFYSIKYPVKNSLLFIVASILVSFFIGSFMGVAFAILYGATGLMMGYCIKKKESKKIVYVGSSIVFLFGLVLFFVFSSVFFNLNFLAEFNDVLRSSVDQYIDTLEKLGQSPPEELKSLLSELGTFFMTMIPSILIGTAFFITFIFISVNFPILKRLGIDVPKFQPFRHFSFPKSILWIYLLILIVSLMVRTDLDSYLHMVLLNAGFVLQTLLVIQGLAFIFYYADIKKWTKAIPIVAVILTFILPFFLSIVRLLGIIDIGFDLRQRLNQK